jgi:DDE_Tnp_1-like zinc-ribbon
MAHWNPSVAAKKKIRGTHRAFCETLVEALLIQYKPTPPTRIYTQAGQLPIAQLDKPRRIHERVKSSSCGKCIFCRFRINMLYTRLGHIGPMPPGERIQQSRMICKHCGVYLCANCFELFHDFKSIH